MRLLRWFGVVLFVVLFASASPSRAQETDRRDVILDLTSGEAFALARELPSDARPDLVLLAHEGEDLLFARPASVIPAISAPPRGGGVEVLLGRSDAMSVGFEMLAVPLDEADETAAPAGAAFATAVGEAYCREYGAHLPGGHLEREIDVPEIAGLAAQIVREFSGADVAFLNEGAINTAFHPADPEQLSRSDFYVALEYDEPLQVADVPAVWLLEALQRARARGIATPGLDHEADELAEAETSDLRVRDRAPVEGVMYRVATIRFLAAGGDGGLPVLPEGTHTLPDGTARYHSLRDVVVAALERENADDPRDARADPNTPPEWVIRGGIEGDFAGSNVRNPSMYDAALLATETSIAMGLEVNLVIDATAPDYTWENRVYGSFRTQWAPSTEPDTAGEFIEANDQIQLRSMASWRGPRATDSGRRGRAAPLEAVDDLRGRRSLAHPRRQRRLLRDRSLRGQPLAAARAARHGARSRRPARGHVRHDALRAARSGRRRRLRADRHRRAPPRSGHARRRPLTAW